MSQWGEGEVVRDAVEWIAPSDLAAGTHDLILGLWDPGTGQRLRLGERALPEKKDRVVVGRLMVGG